MTLTQEQKDFPVNLLLNSAVPTFVLDTQHQLITWNKACEALTGVKAAEILGSANHCKAHCKAFYRKERHVLADFIIDGNIEDLPQYYDSFNKSPFTPEGLQAEVWCFTANDKERFVSLATFPGGSLYLCNR